MYILYLKLNLKPRNKNCCYQIYPIIFNRHNRKWHKFFSTKWNLLKFHKIHGTKMGPANKSWNTSGNYCNAKVNAYSKKFITTSFPFNNISIFILNLCFFSFNFLLLLLWRGNKGTQNKIKIEYIYVSNWFPQNILIGVEFRENK